MAAEITCIAYIRVSRMELDDEQKQSPDSQLHSIRDYCNRKGYVLLEEHVYKDLDVSGGKENRPAFQQMFKDIEEGKVKPDVLAVFDLSRFGRNLFHILKYLKRLEEKEIAFNSTQEEFLNTNSIYGKFLIHIFSAIAELQRNQIITTVKTNMVNMVRHGGQKGFGGGLIPDGYLYEKTNKVITIDPVRSLII
ncbi:recombinase family protein [Paenibacillus periandrae]|uniref:recombinase family protein n=1 Tax=Paenibacillus periandrae TaxID=1761741 RepID=UPI001F08C864|nr:recombinase family protein [Paenibacillus periandrae]